MIKPTTENSDNRHKHGTLKRALAYAYLYGGVFVMTFYYYANLRAGMDNFNFTADFFFLIVTYILYLCFNNLVVSEYVSDRVLRVFNWIPPIIVVAMFMSEVVFWGLHVTIAA